MNAQELINKFYEHRQAEKLMIVVWLKEDKAMPAAILGCNPEGIITHNKVSGIVTHLSQFFTDEFEFQFITEPNTKLADMQPAAATVH